MSNSGQIMLEITEILCEMSHKSLISRHKSFISRIKCSISGNSCRLCIEKNTSKLAVLGQFCGIFGEKYLFFSQNAPFFGKIAGFPAIFVDL